MSEQNMQCVPRYQHMDQDKQKIALNVLTRIGTLPDHMVIRLMGIADGMAISHEMDLKAREEQVHTTRI